MPSYEPEHTNVRKGINKNLYLVLYGIDFDLGPYDTKDLHLSNCCLSVNKPANYWFSKKGSLIARNIALSAPTFMTRREATNLLSKVGAK